MKHIYKFFLALLVISAAISCSKDDSPETAPTDINGGEIFAMQIVTIPLTNANLSQQQYNGTLRGEAVTLLKSSDNSLVFTVSPVMAPGAADLTVEGLGITVHYEVKETTLTETPDSTLAPLFESLDNYSTVMGTPEVPEHEISLQLVDAFEIIYNDASAEEKEAIAKFYKANETLIDQVMFGAITDMSGRFNPTSLAEVAHGMFVAALQGLVAGCAVIIAADYLVAHPGVFAAAKIIGAIVSGVALGVVINKLRDFISARSKAENVSVGGIQGTNGRNANDTTLNLVDNNSSTTSISTYRRTVNMTDANSTNPLFKSFFSGYNTYTSIISKVNNVITYVNSKIPFTIPQLTVRQIPSSTAASAETVNPEIFNQFSFSVSHPNLQLVTAQLASDGQLTLKVKVIGQPQSLPIVSTLNYSYSDAFSNFSGTLPLKVTQSGPLVGTWIMESFDNGIPVGQYSPVYSSQCPSLVASGYTFTSSSLTFTESEYTQLSQSTYITYLIVITAECEVVGDNPDVVQNYTDNVSGSYILNGNQLTVTNSDGETTVAPITFITQSKILVNGSVFVKQ